MPIHVRAEPGQYADAVLLPGDPLRAKYIAETYLDDVVQRNAERGLLGYTGTYKGKPVSVQGTGMGCPGATIVFEELVQLGCKKLIRVGTCGGLQPHHQLGDLIVALTAVPADSTAMHLVGNEPHCPTASWSIIHGAVHTAKEIGQELHVGPIVSSDVFYNPDEGQYERWSKRGVLAVEMEASALFTVGAHSRRRDGLPAHRQRHRRGGRVQADQRRRPARVGRSHDARSRSTSRSPISTATVFLVNPASDGGATGQALARAGPPRGAPRTRRARRCSRSARAI